MAKALNIDQPNELNNGGDDDMLQMRTTRLDKYLDEMCRNYEMPPKNMDEYVKEQRQLIDHTNLNYLMKKMNAKIHPTTFLAVNVLYVASARDFYVVEVCDMESLIDFQNLLNRTYDEDAEPIGNLKIKDLCAVFYDFDWRRCEVIRIELNNKGKKRYTVQLIDYGRTIVTKGKHLCLLKAPHNAVAPYAIKCQLSELSLVDFSDEEKTEFKSKFEQYLSGTKEVSIYVNALIKGSVDVYDVFLFIDIQANVNTTDQAYLLHEAYGAFVQSKIPFDSDLCKDWLANIFQMASDSCNDFSKKIPIFLSFIESPLEIYVKSRATKKIMQKLRRIIDAYVAKIHENDDIDSVENQLQRQSTVWLTGMNCLVRVQSWKTISILKLWFRGRVIGIDTVDNTVKVFLRDSGRTVEAQYVDVMLISAELTAPRDAILKCYLTISNDWLETSTDLLFSIIGEYKYFAISCEAYDENGLAVTLWATNQKPDPKDIDVWDNVGLRLISQSINTSLENFIENEHIRFNLGETSSSAQSQEDADSAGSNSLLHGRLVDKWPRPLPIGRTTFVGIVMHITEKGTIYLQEESNMEVVHQLDRSITEHIRNTFHPEKFKNKVNWTWKVGDTCFAPYDDDWYHRAVVKKINRERALCLIKYVDYGNKVITKLNCIYPASKFGDIPIMAHRLYATNIVSGRKSGKWNPEILDTFRKKLVNEACDVRLEDVPELENMKTLPCKIEAKRMPCEIGKWLIKQRLGLDTNIDEHRNGILIV